MKGGYWLYVQRPATLYELMHQFPEEHKRQSALSFKLKVGQILRPVILPEAIEILQQGMPFIDAINRKLENALIGKRHTCIQTGFRQKEIGLGVQFQHQMVVSAAIMKRERNGR